jgi:hypothetical protein
MCKPLPPGPAQHRIEITARSLGAAAPDKPRRKSNLTDTIRSARRSAGPKVEARRLRNSPDDLGTVFVSYSQDDQDPVKPAYLGHK